MPHFAPTNRGFAGPPPTVPSGSGGKMAQKIEIKKILEKATEVAKEAFSLTNLTVSLLSTLLVIGVSYLSGIVGQSIQLKAYSNPTIYLSFLIVTFMCYFWAITGPAFLASAYKKNWPSFVYIILLEIVWLTVFIAILYFTTPTKELPQMIPM